MNNSLSVLILAGGRSSRMGRDKARIEIDRVPMLRRIYDAVAGCEEVVPERIAIVTPWMDRYLSILPTTCGSIVEPEPQQGPLVAFASGLAQISTPWVLLLACDRPIVDRRTAIGARSQYGLFTQTRPQRLGAIMWFLSPQLLRIDAGIYYQWRSIVSRLAETECSYRNCDRRSDLFGKL
jgi:hypothetical protein